MNQEQQENPTYRPVVTLIRAQQAFNRDGMEGQAGIVHEIVDYHLQQIPGDQDTRESTVNAWVAESLDIHPLSSPHIETTYAQFSLANAANAEIEHFADGPGQTLVDPPNYMPRGHFEDVGTMVRQMLDLDILIEHLET